jgi:hypothetical protein
MTTITIATRKLLFPGLPSTRRYYYHSTTPVHVHFAFHLFCLHDTTTTTTTTTKDARKCGILSHQRCMTLADLSADL